MTMMLYDIPVKMAVQRSGSESCCIDVVNVTVSPDYTNLTVYVENTGTKVIVDLWRADVLVYYVDNATSMPRAFLAAYDSSWRILLIQLPGGYSEPYSPPRGLEPGEIAVLEVTLPSPMSPTSPARVVIAFPCGAKDYVKFYPGG